MALPAFDTLVSYLRRIGPEGSEADQEDGLLLAHFARGDQAAFTALVRRYSPLVWNVCNRVLRQPQDAEDAFQATFLVLVRNAAALAGTGALGPWLHSVASRTAVKARARAARRTACEMAATGPTHVACPDPLAHEVRAIIDEEVAQLPDRYRLPVVLCYLEGLTNEEAARRLCCPDGTIRSRLARARDRLRGRLLRRGLGVPAAGLAALTGSSARALPPAVVDNFTCANALLQNGASTSVLSLAEGALPGMFLSKLKLVGLALLVLALTASGAGLFRGRQASPDSLLSSVRKESSPGTPRQKTGGSTEKTPKTPNKAKQKAEKAKQKPAVAPGNREAELREKLVGVVDFQGLDDPRTSLFEVLDQLTKVHQVAFEVNEKAFKAENIDKILAFEVAADIPIPPRKASLQRVLKVILARIPAASGAIFLLRGDHIEITTQNAFRAELGLPLLKGDKPDQPVEHLLPLVREDFRKLPLDEVLGKLAEATDFSIVIDTRVEEKANVKVTARLANVPLDIAVRLLTDMAGLGVVRMGNVFYVTSADNAKRLQPARKTSGRRSSR